MLNRLAGSRLKGFRTIMGMSQGRVSSFAGVHGPGGFRTVPPQEFHFGDDTGSTDFVTLDGQDTTPVDYGDNGNTTPYYLSNDPNASGPATAGPVADTSTDIPTAFQTPPGGWGNGDPTAAAAATASAAATTDPATVQAAQNQAAASGVDWSTWGSAILAAVKAGAPLAASIVGAKNAAAGLTPAQQAAAAQAAAAKASGAGIIPGVPNWLLFAAAGLGFYLYSKKAA
jgi:hypothetical protein